MTPGAPNGDSWYLPGVSPMMCGIQRVAAEIAATDLPVLVAGERGTGKEVLALHIHRLSRRREQAFSKLNSSALSLETLQRFLLRRGNGDGTSLSSHGGTLLLDEVEELDPSCQSALADSLGRFDDASGREPAGARVICSTSKNLEERMRSVRFSEELYFRITSVSLSLPPLRHRREEIPALLEFFLRKSASYFGRPQPVLTSRTLRVLTDYSWPGNVRELETAAKNIVALGDEELELADLCRLGLELPPRDGVRLGTSLKEAARAASRRAERELVLKVLTRTRWNRKLAAKELQISYKALLYKLKYLDLEHSVSS
jgi:two-component system, NtrC family, response regulator AtoC